MFFKILKFPKKKLSFVYRSMNCPKNCPSDFDEIRFGLSNFAINLKNI